MAESPLASQLGWRVNPRLRACGPQSPPYGPLQAPLARGVPTPLLDVASRCARASALRGLGLGAVARVGQRDTIKPSCRDRSRVCIEPAQAGFAADRPVGAGLPAGHPAQSDAGLPASRPARIERGAGQMQFVVAHGIA